MKYLSFIISVGAIAGVTTFIAFWANYRGKEHARPMEATARPVTTIVREGPLRFAPVESHGTAEIPMGVEFGLMCDLDGVLQSGDWKVAGTVTSVDHDAGIVLFDTEEFRVRDEVRKPVQKGRLAYRLPHGLIIPLSAGDPITILHDHEHDSKRSEYDLHIASGEELIFAVAHQHDDSPPRSAKVADVLFEGAPGGEVIFYWPDPADDDLIQDVKKVGSITTPLAFRIADNPENREIQPADEGVTDIEISGQAYHLVVLTSEFLPVAEQELEPGSDPNGETSHSLECFLVKSAR